MRIILRSLFQRLSIVLAFLVSFNIQAETNVSNCATFVKDAQFVAKRINTKELVWLTDSNNLSQKQLAKSVVHALVKGFGMYPEVAVEVVSRSCAANKLSSKKKSTFKQKRAA